MNKNTPIRPERQGDQESIQMFGRHVSREKGAVLLAVTLAVCAMPIILGLRLWDRIPETVATGLIGPDGRDDSLPRAAVVFLLPGLMCLLNLITHAQLWVSQRQKKRPKAHIRLMGRWGFPVVSLLFCGFVILRAAGAVCSPLLPAQCALGLGLMLLGSHLWDGRPGEQDPGRRWPGMLLLGLGLLASAGAVLAGGLAAGR